MEYGILRKNELHNDIVKIKFYSDEEFESLKKIYNTIVELETNYKSNNNKYVNDYLNSMWKNSKKLVKNRRQYISILNKQICKYEKTASLVVKRMTGGDQK